MLSSKKLSSKKLTDGPVDVGTRFRATVRSVRPPHLGTQPFDQHGDVGVGGTSDMSRNDQRDVPEVKLTRRRSPDV